MVSLQILPNLIKKSSVIIFHPSTYCYTYFRNLLENTLMTQLQRISRQNVEILRVKDQSAAIADTSNWAQTLSRNYNTLFTLMGLYLAFVGLIFQRVTVLQTQSSTGCGVPLLCMEWVQACLQQLRGVCWSKFRRLPDTLRTLLPLQGMDQGHDQAQQMLL